MDKLASFEQSSFSGGMRRSVDPSQLGDTEYALLINGRSRYGVITPVKLPLQLTQGLPSTSPIFQGIYGAGSFLVTFAGGKAYYRDFSMASPFFNLIAGFQMTVDAPTLFAELVPASTVNFKRIPVDVDKKNLGINISSIIGSTPSALVVQDGKLQPRLIFPDSTTRVSKNWLNWMDTDREYVPIGKQMLYKDGILYIVSPDGKELFHSVTGRPLDFMVAIDAAGNKFGTEADSGASAVSHRIDFDEVTCINRLNSPGFLVTTAKNSYLTIPDPTNTIYGEPTFANQFLFSTGALNQFSVTDILGDTALIDFSGIRSFDAVSQLKFEGNNAPFSRDIFPLLENIIQTVTAAITFDNYALFAVTTIYGAGMLVYDTILKKYAAIDIYPGVSAIKQFAEVKLTNKRLLFFITTDNKLYQAFAGETAKCQLFTREFAVDPSTDHKAYDAQLAFIDAKENGVLSVTEYTDRFAGAISSVDVEATMAPQTPPITPPFGASTKDTTAMFTFRFNESKEGWKTGLWIEWNFDSSLAAIALDVLPRTGLRVSKEQQAAAYAR